MIVSNSSPIISIGTIGRMDLFRKCCKEVIIPFAVYTEISQKKESPEFLSLKKAIEEKWVKVEKITLLPSLRTVTLGEGEKEAISLAAKHKLILIIDDDMAKKYAEIMGVEPHGTLYVLILAVRKKILNKKEAVDILHQMMKAGFYISTDVYAIFLAEI